MNQDIQETPCEVIQLRPKTIELSPITVDAINYEMADAQFRLEQRVRVIAHLHRVIDTMRQYCEHAKLDCMHQRSVQAMALTRAIEVADMAVPR